MTQNPTISGLSGVRDAQAQLETHVAALAPEAPSDDATPYQSHRFAGVAHPPDATAAQSVRTAVAAVEREDKAFNSFTRVLAERAATRAAILDRGSTDMPLFGIPFAAKDLFDVEGLPTTAGSKLRADAPPAHRDAPVIVRLEAAGAVLIGTLNMDEFAYGFVTRNAHYGDTRNPVAPDRIAGGSSGGTAAAVAAGFVPMALGSDTNGSIRIPAAFCGLWALRPGDGRITHEGMFPFARSLDQPGLIARSAKELSTMFDCVRDTARNAASSDRKPRLGRLTGWFRRNADEGMGGRLDAFCQAYGEVVEIDISEAAQARSAAYVITAAEGGALHAATLASDWDKYDPATRERLMAGALLPARPYIAARDVRRRFRASFDRLFDQVDYLIAPTTPVCAPLFDQQTMIVDGKELPARAHLGVLTQPLSLAGVPIISAPATHPSGLPMGIQIIGPRGCEEELLAFAATLEAQGLLGLERGAQ